MKKNTYKAILITAYIFYCHTGYGQDTPDSKRKVIYKLKPKIDVPIVLGCATWCGYTLTEIYTKGPSTQEEILNLSINNINILLGSITEALSGTLVSYFHNHKIIKKY